MNPAATSRSFLEQGTIERDLEPRDCWLPGCDDPDAPFTLGVDDDEEPSLRVRVETKTVLALTAAGVWLMDGLRIKEGRGCEAEVKDRVSLTWSLLCSSHPNSRSCKGYRGIAGAVCHLDNQRQG